MKIAIIDNYDSFTYNLVHLVEELGVEVAVMRNDQFQLPDLAQFDKLLLSPGPGIPSEAGLLPGVIREYAARKSILGVCLGHQAIAEVFGARLENLSDVFHGIATPCRVLQADRLYSGLPGEFVVGRYHSWVVSHDAFPSCLQITAESNDGEIMSIRHREYDVCGIQYHPESILTPLGKDIIGDWLNS